MVAIDAHAKRALTPSVSDERKQKDGELFEKD
jgi:hypothetical protein